MKYLTKIYTQKGEHFLFIINSLLNRINWKRAIKKAYRMKKKYKRDFFIIPAGPTKLGITDGWYPLNKQWLVKLKGKQKRLKYSRLIKLAYYSTIGCVSYKQALKKTSGSN